MEKNLHTRSSKPVAIWLLIGVGMIMIQVLLGGITRLTGSGLSITEWKPIMGTLPPMNDHAWNEAFEKYKQIAQFKYVNSHFTLSDFKSIFFWEWFHRLWARLIAVAFAIPFVIFIIQKRFKKEMIRPMLILFLLGALQGLVGWIMVQSGLEDSELIYVSHYKLAVHFILAFGVLCYALWFALDLLVPKEQRIVSRPINNYFMWMIVLLTIQLSYGAFMAGLKAAPAAPTWPDINGEWIPSKVHSYGGRNYDGLSWLTAHPIVVHFIHRTLAYLITLLVLIGWIRTVKINGSLLYKRVRVLPLLLVSAQVILGILAVLNSPTPSSFIWLAEAHQLVAMMLLLSLVLMIYLVKRKPLTESLAR
jgi:cytochrome c oxidase assembly protein subunit 15